MLRHGSVRRFVHLEVVDQDEGRSNEELESARLRVKSVQRKSASETSVAAYIIRRTRMRFI